MMEVKNEYKMTEIGEIPSIWNIKTLASISKKIVGGGTPSRKNNEFYVGDIPWITVKDMQGDFYQGDSEEHINEEAIKMSASNLIEPGNVVIATRISLGKGFINTRSMAINQDLKAIYLNNDEIINSYFLYWYLSNAEYIKSLGSGTTVKGIRLEQLIKLKLPIPSLFEQQKIAEILTTVDEQIEQTDQLIEKTKELKKGLMQQLLTKGIGHTKFKQTDLGGIPVEWEIVLFEDIMLSKGEGIRRGPFGGALKKEIFVDKGFAVYEQQHVIHKNINKFRYFITPEKYNEMAAFNVKSGDILISCSGTIGRVLLVPEDATEGIINQALLRLRPKSYINIQFLKYLLQSDLVQNNILDRAHGSALKNMVAVSELKKIKLRIPQKEEQKKIAEILSSVDEDIEGYEEEKVKYEKLKKGLMQQLLTGKTRVKVD